MKLIELVDEQLRLNSHLNEYSFGKTNYESALAQEGKFWDGKNFSNWSFNDVQAFNVEGKEERIVFYCGNNPLGKQFKSLQDYFEEGGEQMFSAAKLICEVLTKAAEKNIEIPQVGPAGILINSKNSVLFMPQALFLNSTNGLSKTEQFYSQYAILNQSLSELPSICFTRACIAYKALTGFFPFEKEDLVERNSDILDKNFMPVELCIQNINSQLAKEINRGLKLNSNIVNIPGKRKKGKSSEDLTPSKEFPIELLDEAWKLAKEQQKNGNKEFEERARNYMKSKNSRISAKRKLRKNSLTIAAIFIVAAIAGFITLDTVNAKQSELTSKGLTSVQTIQAFFYGVNTQATTLLDNISKGKSSKRFIDTVSQVFVLSKQRESYGSKGFVTPENWLIYSTTENRYDNSTIYGITNLRIDGSDKISELDVKMYSFKDNPEPVTKEGNVSLSKGSVSVHTADYYFIYSDGEEHFFQIEKRHSTFTLTFMKERWIITDIITESEIMDVDCNEFKSDYFKALSEFNNNQLEAVESLRDKYIWLPTSYAMKTENDRLIWEAEHPMEVLGF